MSDLPTGTVTFLFTDIEGSTRLQYEVGVERYAEIRAEHHRALREACSRHGGVEVDAAGDGLFVAFPTAAGAVAAAVDGQLAVKDLVGVRMGVHSGEPLLTPDGYAGVEVARAARISAVAHGGQIVLSQATAELVGDHAARFALRDLGEHVLKDLSRPQRLFQLVTEGLHDEFPPLRSVRDRRTNLPAQRPELIGREDELRQLAELLHDSARRLVTLTGPGGTGKSALAVEAAARIADDFEDGVFLVRLETVDDPSLVLSAIADVLPVSKPEGVAPERLVADFLRETSALIVLDTFEYVLDAAPAVSELAAGSEHARFLVTSVVPLRVSAEVEVPVQPLALPSPVAEDLEAVAGSSAVALFTERARGVRPTFALTAENASSVARVCIALDGLPLALELAAARTKVLSPSALLERIERPLALLEGGSRDAPDRHRTLRATIDWSYALLEEPPQRLLARMSVFNGGATLEAVDAVCRPTGDLGIDLVDGLAQLVECSMLKTEERGGDLRFVLLETLREYARERLDVCGETLQLAQRHAEFFLGDPALSEEYLVGEQARSMIARVEADLDNIRSALDWAHSTRSPLELPLVVLYQRSPRVFPAEAVYVLERALGSGGGSARMRARALAAVGGFARMQADPDKAYRCFAEAARLYREVGDTTGKLAQALLRSSHAASDLDDLETAERLASESEQVARAANDPIGRGLALVDLGEIAIARGELNDARRLLTEADVLLEGHHVAALGALAELEIVEGNSTAAVGRTARLLERLDTSEPDQRDGWITVALHAAALMAAGRTDAAVGLYAASGRRHTERGTSLRIYWSPSLYERLFGELERAVHAPDFEAAAREGYELALEGAVALGVAAAGVERA